MDTPTTPAAPMTPVEHTFETFSFLGLLDRTFRLYRDNFATFVGVAAVVLIPLSIIQFVLTVWNQSFVTGLRTPVTAANARAQLNNTGNELIVLLLLLLLVVIQAALETGAITYAASELYLGRKVTIRQAFRARANRFTNVGCGYVLFFVLITVFSVVVGVVGVFFVPAFACFGGVIYIGIAGLVFLTPVLMLENVFTPLGMNRAWSLGKARFWTVVALYGTLALFVSLFNLAFSTVFRDLLVAVTGPLGTVPTLAVTSFLTAISSIFLAPIVPIAATLLYHDTRNRLEGLDFALQALGTPDARPADVPSPRPQTGLIGRDWLNVGIIVAVSVLLILAISPLVTTALQRLTPTFNQ